MREKSEQEIEAIAATAHSFQKRLDTLDEKKDPETYQLIANQLSKMLEGLSQEDTQAVNLQRKLLIMQDIAKKDAANAQTTSPYSRPDELTASLLPSLTNELSNSSIEKKTANKIEITALKIHNLEKTLGKLDKIKDAENHQLISNEITRILDGLNQDETQAVTAQRLLLIQNDIAEKDAENAKTISPLSRATDEPVTPSIPASMPRAQAVFTIGFQTVLNVITPEAKKTMAINPRSIGDQEAHLMVIETTALQIKSTLEVISILTEEYNLQTTTSERKTEIEEAIEKANKKITELRRSIVDRHDQASLDIKLKKLGIELVSPRREIKIRKPIDEKLALTTATYGNKTATSPERKIRKKSSNSKIAHINEKSSVSTAFIDNGKKKKKAPSTLDLTTATFNAINPPRNATAITTSEVENKPRLFGKERLAKEQKLKREQLVEKKAKENQSQDSQPTATLPRAAVKMENFFWDHSQLNSSVDSPPNSHSPSFSLNSLSLKTSAKNSQSSQSPNYPSLTKTSSSDRSVSPEHFVQREEHIINIIKAQINGLMDPLIKAYFERKFIKHLSASNLTDNIISLLASIKTIETINNQMPEAINTHILSILEGSETLEEKKGVLESLAKNLHDIQQPEGLSASGVIGINQLINLTIKGIENYLCVDGLTIGGINRANFYLANLKDSKIGIGAKLTILQSLLTNPKDSTLQEMVLVSINNKTENTGKIVRVIKAYQQEISRMILALRNSALPKEFHGLPTKELNHQIIIQQIAQPITKIANGKGLEKILKIQNPFQKSIALQQIIKEINNSVTGRNIPFRPNTVAANEAFNIIKQKSFELKTLTQLGKASQDNNMRSKLIGNANDYNSQITQKILDEIAPLQDIINKVIYGIENYQKKEFAARMGIFGIKHHNDSGSQRASFYKMLLESEELGFDFKLAAILSLFHNEKGKTLDKHVRLTLNNDPHLEGFDSIQWIKKLEHLIEKISSSTFIPDECKSFDREKIPATDISFKKTEANIFYDEVVNKITVAANSKGKTTTEQFINTCRKGIMPQKVEPLNLL